jgi:3-dehydroquinate dehydratase-1
MPRLGPLALGALPRIAVPFDGTLPRESVQALRARGLDAAELRVDLFGTREPERVLARVEDFAGLPTLATIRLRGEGGAWAGSEAERLALFEALLPRVDGIDVELAAESRDEAVAAARAAGRLRVLSHHDFAKTPDPSALADVVARAREAGADVVKVASAVHGPDDVRGLARLLLDSADVPLVVIGMGEAALATRLLFAALGSLLTYAHAGRPTAPGQIGFDEMLALVRRLFPAYDAEKVAAGL